MCALHFILSGAGKARLPTSTCPSPAVPRPLPGRPLCRASLASRALWQQQTPGSPLKCSPVWAGTSLLVREWTEETLQTLEVSQPTSLTPRARTLPLLTDTSALVNTCNSVYLLSFTWTGLNYDSVIMVLGSPPSQCTTYSHTNRLNQLSLTAHACS